LSRNGIGIFQVGAIETFIEGSKRNFDDDNSDNVEDIFPGTLEIYR
jgi:hypothetical protein